MELILSDDDARLLRDLLSDFLHDLRLEVARTEAKDFRHVMLMRQEVVERLLAQLGGPACSMTAVASPSR